MNSAAYVDKLIEQLKNSGIPLSQAAWEAACACAGWPYTFGARGGKTTKDGVTVRTFDCRGFTYWILLQIYGWKLMGAGCTSQWNNEENWREKGTVAEGIPADTIVCLFYYKKDEKTGKRTSTLEHTGFYYNGQTVECSAGVKISKTINKKWEVWGVPACVSGEIPAPVPPDPDKKPTLRKGDQGASVTELQEDLVKLGYELGTYGPEKNGVDGKFGKKTEDAVKAFQKDHDGPDGKALKIDGVAGSGTWWAIGQAMGTKQEPETRYTVTITRLTHAQAKELLSQFPGATMKEEEQA
jgi:hypothetical protein